MSRIWADPEAFVAAASLVQREWGPTGYRIIDAESPGFSGAVVLTVRASDGGTFYVASTRHGNTCHGETKGDVDAKLQDLYKKEATP